MKLDILRTQKKFVFDSDKAANQVHFTKKQQEINLFDSVTGKIDQGKLIVPAKYEKKDNI